MKQYFSQIDDQAVWDQFAQKFSIDLAKQEQFKRYFDLILQENQKYNITAITSIKSIILDHFYDSLAITFFEDLSVKRSIVDVGSGAGFPGIPLAIMFESVTVHLLEVNHKKIQFLHLVVQELGLSNVVIHTDDWRTFLRVMQEPIDIFIARASLQVEELLRVYQPSFEFKNSTLIYWASKNWVPSEDENWYLDQCKMYDVGDKKRMLCFFKYKSH